VCYLIILCVILVLHRIEGVKELTEKMTVLNIRMSTKEKEELKEIAVQNGESISSYARKMLFQPDNTGDYNDNTVVIQEKDERISDLKSQIDDYKKQIEQLHTIILATQKDNQLLIEQKAKRWWKFWK
jgi:hypothetical protein